MSSTDILSTLAKAQIPSEGRDPNIIRRCIEQYSAVFKHTVYGIIMLVIWLVLWIISALTGSSSTIWVYIRYAILLMGIALVVSGIYWGVLVPEKFEAMCIMRGGNSSDIHPASLPNVGGGCPTCASGGCPTCSGGKGGGCPTCSGGGVMDGLTQARDSLMALKNKATEMTNEVTNICAAVQTPEGKQACQKLSEGIAQINNMTSTITNAVQPISDLVNSIKNIPGASRYLK